MLLIAHSQAIGQAAQWGILVICTFFFGKLDGEVFTRSSAAGSYLFYPHLTPCESFNLCDGQLDGVWILVSLMRRDRHSPQKGSQSADRSANYINQYSINRSWSTPCADGAVLQLLERKSIEPALKFNHWSLVHLGIVNWATKLLLTPMTTQFVSFLGY